MIMRIVAFALRMPFVVLATAVALLLVGAAAYRQLDIEAYPNPVPPMVEIITQPSGASAEEAERYVTVPLEVGLAGMPGLDHVRSQSQFSLSDVKCYFKWGTEYALARQEVINRIAFVTLPSGSEPTLSPWSAIGEVFRYTVRGKGYTTQDLKTAEDWILERQFKQVDGVIDVVSFGGETKQYHVKLDPYRLKGQGVTLDEVLLAIGSSNRNVGGQRLTIGEQSYDVRGVGLLRGVHDIENIVVSEENGIPIRLHDVALVDIGAKPRMGIVGRDNDSDVVQGTVLMRYAAETPHTLDGIYQRVDYIRANHILPPGIDIEPYYDRGKLVALTTHTVLENVLVGIALVTLVLWVFLSHARAALITAINIPIALLIAFSGMVATKTPANLISIGAVDFGIVVHSTVIMMENIFQHLGSHGKGTMRDRILVAAREVAGPMSFSTLIIGVAFLPLFTMTGVAGVIFSPMAYTYAFSIGGCILLALTLTPVLADKLIPVTTEEKENFILKALHKVYHPIFDFGVRRPTPMVIFALVPIVLLVVLFPMLGKEFMPKLEEGNFWIRASFPTSISLEHSERYVGRMRSILRGCPDDPNIACTDENREFPEVVTVISQHGRPDDGTDSSGFYNVELFAPLKPFGEWKKGLTKEMLTEELSRRMTNAFPEVVFNFSQMISDNVEEAVSGVKGENSIKVVGADLASNERYAEQIVDVMGTVDGVKDLGMFHSLGQPNVKIVPDRAACARYGLNSGDVEDVIQAAIGGQAVTQVYEREKYFDLTVRWLEPYRQSIEAIREITISTKNNATIPLGQIATITLEDGPSVIYREDGKRYSPIKFSVRGRDLGSTIADAQKQLAEKVKLPYDTHLEWDGEINQLKEATDRLRLIIPITFVLICFLTYSAVKNWVDTLIVIINVPIACTGGVLALIFTHTNFSVSAAMGFISIFGIAVQDAILVVTYFQRLRDVDGLSLPQAAREASVNRFRAGLMATLVATLGLMPAAISHGIGSETQKPLALVIIGGSLMLAIVTRVLQPPLLVFAHRWFDRRPKDPADLPPPPSTTTLQGAQEVG
ncbi:MAG: CusA/CzcA family heavy metal efflux RND transporter [Polyangiales bacterium]